MLGLPKGIVQIAPYSSEWERRFAEEAERLSDAIGIYAADIQHVGSTSVPGLSAKPIIDIAIGLRRIDECTSCIAPLEALGYVYKGEYGLPGRYYFRKGEPRTHQLHLVEIDSTRWSDYLTFRDALRSSTELRERYAEIKEALATEHRTDRAAYTDAKSPFVLEVLSSFPNL